MNMNTNAILPPHVFIIGERCSGTNYLAQMLSLCFPELAFQKGQSARVLDSCILGYKHWPHLCGLALAPAHLKFVIITRNVIDWLVSMTAKFWNLEHINRGGLSALMHHKPWFSHEYGDATKRIAHDADLPLGSMYHDVFDMRAKKHQFWVQAFETANLPTSQYTHIKYEDLLQDPFSTMQELGRCLGLRFDTENVTMETMAQSSQRLTHTYSKKAATDSSRAFSVESHKQRQFHFAGKSAHSYKAFKGAEWEYMLDCVDWQTEVELGYEMPAEVQVRSDEVTLIDGWQDRVPSDTGRAEQAARDSARGAEVAYVHLTQMHRDMVDYAGREEARRWAVLGQVIDAAQFNPADAGKFSVCVVDAASLPIAAHPLANTYWPSELERAAFTDALKEATSVVIDAVRITDADFADGVVGFARYVHELGNVGTVMHRIGGCDNEVFKDLRTLLPETTKLIYFLHSIPEQYVPTPSHELIPWQWQSKAYRKTCKGADLHLTETNEHTNSRAAQVICAEVEADKKELVVSSAPNPAYCLTSECPHMPRNEQVFKQLRAAWLSMCTTQDPATIGKEYLEACASGSVCIGDIPSWLPVKFNAIAIKQGPSGVTTVDSVKEALSRKHVVTRYSRQNYSNTNTGAFNMMARVCQKYSAIMNPRKLEAGDNWVLAKWVYTNPLYVPF